MCVCVCVCGGILIHRVITLIQPIFSYIRKEQANTHARAYAETGSMASRVLYGLGTVLRETGQAMDRLGCMVMGNMAPAEQRTYQRTNERTNEQTDHPARAP